MYSKVSELSGFVLGLHGAARDRGVSDLVAWAVAQLADILGYDCAWYGWAQVQQTGTVIHASTTFNLPRHYFNVWSGMADQDVIVEKFIADPTSVPIYDRFGNTQTDGMEYLADSFGISKMATAMCLRRERTASFYLSVYRGGPRARHWSRSDREFLQCAVDNISAAARVAGQNDLTSLDGQTTSVFLSHHGATIVGLGKMRERFGHLWSRSDGDRLPRWLADFVDQPGEHLLPQQELVASCEPVFDKDGMSWLKLSLRPLRKFDFLTTREREVARVLANGHSHKQAAKILGVAPSTVRNHTQSIYGKLGIDNRASLAGHVREI